jgi:hypothetical protein
MQSERERPEPETLVRYFKYYRQKTDPNVSFIVPFKMIGTSVYYSKNRKWFNRLADIVWKYGIDHNKFIKFCVLKLGITEGRDLLKSENFKRYADYLKLFYQYKRIYERYISTAEYIADRCIVEGTTPAKFIGKLIRENRLGYEYMAGRISKHFIASIQNFDKLFTKLDKINQDELRIILEVSGELNHDIQDAFLMFKSQRVKPISFTERMIEKRLS